MVAPLRAVAVLALAISLAACPHSSRSGDGGPDGGPDGGAPPGSFCSLSGSYIANAMTGSSLVGMTLIGSSPSCNGLSKGATCSMAPGEQGTCLTSVCTPGGPATCLVCTQDLSWMQIPPGYCAHWFGNVGNSRQLRVAPGGELFVASPDTPTTSNGPGGRAGIIVLTDDNQDGYADTPTSVFLNGLPETQGMMFTPGWFYYQDSTCIRRLPYTTGERVSTGAGNTATNSDICAGINMHDAQQYGEGVIDITEYSSSGHWPKTLDVADDGTIYVGNGGDQGEMCYAPMPFHGGIWEIDGTPGGDPVVKGLRNPIGVRCQQGHDNCFAVELAQDYSWNTPGSEKLLLIHPGDNWGYPCCADKDLGYVAGELMDGGVMRTTAYQASDAGPEPIGPADCSQITQTTNGFEIAETPFGLDFAPPNWPATWANRVMVVLHGQFASWSGARVVAIQTDPSTGLPLPSSDLDGGMPAAQADFATGWDDDRRDHGRPTAVVVSPDGRVFLSNDQTGDIIWLAPLATLSDGGVASDAGAGVTDAGTVTDAGPSSMDAGPSPMDAGMP